MLARITKRPEQADATLVQVLRVGQPALESHLRGYTVGRSAGGKRGLLLESEVARRLGRSAWLGQRADPLPGLLPLPAGKRELDIQQRALDVLFRREWLLCHRPSARCVLGSTRGSIGARRAECEFG